MKRVEKGIKTRWPLSLKNKLNKTKGMSIETHAPMPPCLQDRHDTRRSSVAPQSDTPESFLSRFKQRIAKETSRPHKLPFRDEQESANLLSSLTEPPPSPGALGTPIAFVLFFCLVSTCAKVLETKKHADESHSSAATSVGRKENRSTEHTPPKGATSVSHQ